ncbi:hypothetical protein N9I21_03470 [Crocinitomicaceae bacterium]|nr:hypothetical protein [Crocinitomicaceae bacterium]
MSDFGNLKYKNGVVIDTRTKKLANGTYQKGNKMTCEFVEGQKHGQQIYSDKKGRTRKIFLWEKGQLMDYKEFDRKGERVFNIKTEDRGDSWDYVLFSTLTIIYMGTLYYYNIETISRNNPEGMDYIRLFQWFVPIGIIATLFTLIFSFRKFGFRRQITNKNNELEP